MVRSMYSGVVGMRAQQSAMDVIGNNIANVKTYGYKSSRATFKDVYYQKVSNGSAATSSRGGTNASQIGYGAQLGTIDVLHGQSSFAMTGRSLDMAIAGEGFFQVMDSEGSVFYTRAGQMFFDPMGNLVDSNGNFVLGVSGDPLGRSGASEKIQLQIPNVNPTPASVSEMINNNTLTITATNNTDAGNVSFNFMEGSTLPAGLPCKAERASGGTSISVMINPTETFATLADFQKAVNDAILEMNNGEAHPAGTFNFSFTPQAAFTNITGAEIVSKDYSVIPGKFEGGSATDVWPNDLFGGMKVVETSTNFIGSGTVNFVDDVTKDNSTTPPAWVVTMDINGTKYTGRIDSNRTAEGEFLLKNPNSPYDTITMTHPGYDKLEDLSTDTAITGNVPGETIAAPTAFPNIIASAATPSRNLGLGSKVIKLDGGTEGGAQNINNLDSIVVSADGVITANHPVHGEISVGRIDIATFANPNGLLQSGSTYFQIGPNAGVMDLSQPGKDGAGELVTSSLEQSNVDLSQEFSDMITTQRAYQANSRMITVSDTMLEELVNLKR